MLLVGFVGSRAYLGNGCRGQAALFTRRQDLFYNSLPFIFIQALCPLTAAQKMSQVLHWTAFVKAMNCKLGSSLHGQLKCYLCTMYSHASPATWLQPVLLCLAWNDWVEHISLCSIDWISIRDYPESSQVSGLTHLPSTSQFGSMTGVEKSCRGNCLPAMGLHVVKKDRCEFLGPLVW